MNHYVRVLTTLANETIARKISIELINLQLAACVQRTPITSVYRWKGSVCENSEFQLAIKTCACCVKSIQDFLNEYSGYEVTQILVCPIQDGDAQYLKWLQSHIACNKK